MKDFYVYVLLDPRKPGNYHYQKLIFNFEPFYVGLSSTENRINEHIKESKNGNGYNKHKMNKINKILNENLELIVIKVRQNLTRNEAQKLEISLIKELGRINLKTGPLTNLTDGGDGTVGYIPTNKAKYKWFKSIKKHYENPENRKKCGYYNSIEYFIEKYGIIEGEKRYNERITKIKNSIHKTYSDPEIREKCANKGKHNPMYGKRAPTAIKVEIDRIEYSSIYEAHEKTGIPYTTIQQRLNSKNFPNYSRKDL